ncbi:MAG: hypothetical protein JO006_04345 [Paucibacter sp.]|nr:hypothetical protein [Roseateles sp.]
MQFDHESYSLDIVVKRGHCQWWVADTEGLRQLGIQSSNDPSVSCEAAAKWLTADAHQVYVGPAVAAWPERALRPLT